MLELATVLLKRWKLVAGLPLAAAVLAAVISLIIPAKYTATSTFYPETESDGLSLPTGLEVIVGELGMSVPGMGGTESPDFYVDVLGSRTLLDQVLTASFADPRSEAEGDSLSLLDILGVGGDNQTRRLEEGREELEDATSVDADLETGVITVSVETRYPALSASVTNLYIDLVNRFNTEVRQSNARERRRFVERQAAEAERELRRAEEDLKTFLEQNRQFQGSPELTFQYERLQRQVTIEQEVFTTLRRAYEEARIQEVNDTPVITVIDRAVEPDEKSSPDLGLNVVLALILGSVLAVFGAFGREFAERSRESDKRRYEEFTTRWADFKADLKSLVTRSRRRES
ncbi:MAG: hypothetical protein JSW46_01765 [Gemmatimonadota bacterium]|nr:MAG: hypothetical protein JSW46_01765 [Gemmatimonadota bacterium]